MTQGRQREPGEMHCRSILYKELDCLLWEILPLED